MQGHTMSADALSAVTGDLPTDAQSILALAARSLFDVFAHASEGMLLVDRTGTVVWINDQYRRFLPALGFARESDFVGQSVSSVVENTQMLQVLESGKPILIDLLVNKAGTFVVSRYPLRDAQGQVIGALGVVLFEQAQSNLRPLLSKFSKMQRELDDARQALVAAQRRGGGMWRAKHSLANFIGTSAASLEAKRQARRAAQSSSPVLLLGETGTGKELLAHAIHMASRRAQAPFVSVNIAAVPDTLMEAEFFGVAPGAYTGADRKGREGKFKLADGGTLFLDEIGDMPLTLQAKLLRALQEGEIEPLGSNRLLPVDVRIVAATSRDLPALVRSGAFREDLYYRLNALPMRVPPLRERTSDIPALLEVLAEDLALRNAMLPPELEPAAVQLLMAQPWRGNVRELRNVLEQLLMRSETGRVDAALTAAVLHDAGLPALAPQAAPTAQTLAADEGVRPLWQQVAELERQAVAQAVQSTGGNKVAAARLLGISRAKLYASLSEKLS
jgi:transcriptional regulator with PAS, ATPase and Fis domain